MSNSDKSLQFYGGPSLSVFPTVIYLIGSVVMSVCFHFSSMKSLTVSAAIGILLGFFFCKNKSIYWDAVVRGLTPFGNARLVITFYLIGIFTTLLTTGKIGGGFVWMCMNMGIGGYEFVLFVFVACALISMGTCAPIAALFSVVPIFYPPGILLGANPDLLAGAMLSGVFFGDALSPCSQLTQVTLFSQHDAPDSEPGQLRALLKKRYPTVIVVGIISFVLFAWFAHSGTGVAQHSDEVAQFMSPQGVWMLVPLIALLVIGFYTQNLFLSLNYAIVIGLVVGVLCGTFSWRELLVIDYKAMTLRGIFFDGINSMNDIIISTLLLYGLISLANEGGCINAFCDWFLRRCFWRTRWGAEIAVSLGLSITQTALSGSSLPSILMFNPIAEKLGQHAKVPAQHRCWLLLGLSCGMTAIVPVNSCYMMGIVTLIQGMSKHYPWLPEINPFYCFAFTFYCLLLTLACVIRLLLDSPLLTRRKVKYS